MSEECLLCLEKKDDLKKAPLCDRHQGLMRFVHWQLEERKNEFIELLKKILSHLRYRSMSIVPEERIRQRGEETKLADQLGEFLRDLPSCLPTMTQWKVDADLGTIDPMPPGKIEKMPATRMSCARCGATYLQPNDRDMNLCQKCSPLWSHPDDSKQPAVETRCPLCGATYQNPWDRDTSLCPTCDKARMRRRSRPGSKENP